MGYLFRMQICGVMCHIMDEHTGGISIKNECPRIYELTPFYRSQKGLFSCLIINKSRLSSS